MRYTENDLKVGTKLRCTKAEPVWWTVGKIYNVSLNDDGILQITDDNGHCAYHDYMVYCLNGKHNPVAFEIVEEEKEMKYTEKDLYKGMKLRCIDDGLYDFWKEGAIYTVEENPYGGLIIKGEGDRSDRQTYDILNYLNGETLVKMEIVEDEKEETPTFKTTIDLKSSVQAKIDSLTTEAEHLFKKRDRLEQQAINLSKKARKLNNLIESIKEFE